MKLLEHMGDRVGDFLSQPKHSIHPTQATDSADKLVMSDWRVW